MPLVKVWMIGCSGFADLGVFHDAPLEELNFEDCPLISDLTPLTGKPLRRLGLSARAGFTGVAGVRALPAATIINDLPAAAFWKRYDEGTLK
jgi:hypothetical protein